MIARQDWIEAGLKALREEGQSALTIDALSRSLGVSKGSFYHHFGGQPAFRQALLETWEAELTLKPIEIAWSETKDSAPEERARRLGVAVRQLDHRLELAVRAWGLRESEVQQFVRKVDARRLECLAELHRARGHHQSELLAAIDYAAFMGRVQLGRLAGNESTFSHTMEKALVWLGTTLPEEES